MIVIVDFELGNIRSILYKLKKIGLDVIVSNNECDILNASHIIFCGVGHFAKGMENLIKLKLISILNEAVIIKKIPILGICLGMQLFTNKSEEGNVFGLGWIDSETKKFSFLNKSNGLKVPHVGWNELQIKKKSFIFNDISSSQMFYFTHSYYVTCSQIEDILATSKYGIDFVSAIQHENIYGVQFHPEKSHKEGLNIILNFIKYAIS